MCTLDIDPDRYVLTKKVQDVHHSLAVRRLAVSSVTTAQRTRRETCKPVTARDRTPTMSAPARKIDMRIIRVIL